MATEGTRSYRPKYHYTPEKGWINDPNGLVFDGTYYHLFAQHYPDDTKWGPMHWAHARSKDMLHWEHLPIALYPDSLGMCFSGSACIKDGQIALMYTSHGTAEQQSVAFSQDGISFVPWPGNPVIANPGLPDYRDPKLFPNRQKGTFGVAVAAGDHVEFFSSRDLLSWEMTGTFSDQSRFPGIHECPDLVRMTAPDGSEQSVMIASMISPFGGNRTQYGIGFFDGNTWKMTEPFPEPIWIDEGWDNYAPVTFWGTDAPIMIGWASNWSYADRLPTGEYAGAMTCPRALSLKMSDSGLRLSQVPLMDKVTGAYTVSRHLPGEQFRLHVRGGENFSLSLISTGNERVTVSLTDGLWKIDRTRSGEYGAAPELLEKYGSCCSKRLVKGPAELDLIFDTSLMECFADGGLYAATMQVFPTMPYERVECIGCTCEAAPLEG